MFNSFDTAFMKRAIFKWLSDCISYSSDLADLQLVHVTAPTRSSKAVCGANFKADKTRFA